MFALRYNVFYHIISTGELKCVLLDFGNQKMGQNFILKTGITILPTKTNAAKFKPRAYSSGMMAASLKE